MTDSKQQLQGQITCSGFHDPAKGEFAVYVNVVEAGTILSKATAS